jgi:hypothetical protein
MDLAKRQGVRKNAERWLENPGKASEARRVLAALDAATEAETTALADHVRSMDNAKRVVEAFQNVPMTETERKIVQVLLDHPGETSSGLSTLLDWGGQSWHMHFGEMCKKREVYLWPADDSVLRDASFYSGILADLSEDNRWSMKPDVAAAFTALGLQPQRRAGR